MFTYVCMSQLSVITISTSLYVYVGKVLFFAGLDSLQADSQCDFVWALQKTLFPLYAPLLKLTLLGRIFFTW